MTLDPKSVADRRAVGSQLLREQRPNALGAYILATFNVDLLAPFLCEAFERQGRPIMPSTGPFGRLREEILDPGSGLYAAAPSEVVLVPAAEDLLGPLYSQPPSHLDPPAVAALVDTTVGELEGLVEQLLERLPDATCFVVAYGSDRVPLPHILDPASQDRRQAALERFTDGVRQLGRLSPRVLVVDWDWHVRGGGWSAVVDPRLWYLGRMRLNPQGCAELADLIAVHAAAYRGLVRKVLALDFDGVLWGGVVGETGLDGIEIGGDGLGLAFQDFQRELVLLHDTGTLLAACSKNNPEDAFEVFERHSGMVLRREHFAAERVNWQDKATSLRELAAELELGLDSFVFLDDNPVERDWVRRACPEVLVPELPADPVDCVAFIRSARWFSRVTTTSADRSRARSYREGRERRAVKENAATFEDFLASLDQRVAVEPLDDASLGRAVQLCQRTNQFNLTTKRYDAASLQRLLDDESHELYTLSVSDRFGDSGVTGFAVLRHAGEESVIDTLLLSCRVLGRRVEDAFLAFLATRAAAHGAETLVGLREPTRKNEQTAGFYPDRGFVAVADGVFHLDLKSGNLVVPDHIRIEGFANA